MIEISALERVETQWHEINRKEHKIIKHEDYDELITESSAIYCGNELVGIYLKNSGFDENYLNSVLANLAKLKFVFGPKQRMFSLAATAHTFGWMGRRPLRQDFCHMSVMASTHPVLHGQLVNLGVQANDLYKNLLPEIWNSHNAKMEETIRDEYRICGVYTSGIVNKNSVLGGHVDSNNVPDTWNSQLTLKKGISGGYLAMPELRLGVAVEDNSFLLFKSQQIWHGVTPVYKDKRDSHRYSFVWYSVANLSKCLTPSEELKRIQNLKTNREYERLYT